MPITIRAHFDGKVFVPDEPVDLPADAPVELTVDPSALNDRESPDQDSSGEMSAFADWVESLPPIDRGDLPTDGSKNYKHYLYGHPKQP